MTELGYNKIIDVADFSDPRLLPYLNEIAADEMVRFGLDVPEIMPDSKQWECAMMLRSFNDHGLIKPGLSFAGIGAGTEQTTFVLASKGCITFPTDRYLELTAWSDVAPAAMMARPRQYSMLDYAPGHVLPLHTDARSAELPSNYFDGVYSAGSIEHFGSLEAVSASAEEIGRILKPGGIAALSTEFRLEGPNDRRWFDDNCILFTPSLIQEHIVGPSGLELVDPLLSSTSNATYNSQVVLLDFLAKAIEVRSIEDKRNAYPNLVLFHEGFLFCSVHLCLRKSEASGNFRGPRAAAFEHDVEANATDTSGILTQQIKNWQSAFKGGSQDSPETHRLREELHFLQERVNSLEGAIVTASEAVAQGEAPTFPLIKWQQEKIFAPSELFTVAGVKDKDAIRVQNREGVISFGPYVELSSGRYRAEFGLKVLGGEAELSVDVCCEGERILKEATFLSHASKFAIEFDLDRRTSAVEFRLKALSPITAELTEVTVSRASVALA